MLLKFCKSKNEIITLEETTFKEHNILERQNIEAWIEKYPSFLGEDLIIITTEFSGFVETNERLDLLALDREGKLVVIELKRDDSGKNVDLQAIKYASYCATMTFDDVINEFINYRGLVNNAENYDKYKEVLLNFIQDTEFENIDDKPRIMLVSKEFRNEVTASVLWLRTFGVDISCIKITPYIINEDNIGISSEIIIPTPETEDYLVEVQRKDNSEKVLTQRQQEYLDFYSDIRNLLSKEINLNLPSAKPKFLYQISTNYPALHYEFAFHGRPRDSFEVGLHIEYSNKDKSLDFFNKLKEYNPENEIEFDGELIYDSDFFSNACRIYLEYKSNDGIEKVTDDILHWGIENMVKLIKYYQPKLDKHFG